LLVFQVGGVICKSLKDIVKMNRKRVFNGCNVVASKLSALNDGCNESIERLKRVRQGMILNLSTLEAEAERVNKSIALIDDELEVNSMIRKTMLNNNITN
jgi:hypothetical protein